MIPTFLRSFKCLHAPNKTHFITLFLPAFRFLILQVSVDMDNVVSCDLMDGKNNGKSTFRMVFFNQPTHDLKHYDFEADTKTTSKETHDLFS